MIRTAILFLLIFTTHISITGQGVLPIYNGSFEKDPPNSGFTPSGWYAFPNDQTGSPDIHGRHYRHFGVTQLPSDGDRYLGMVTRPNGSYEGICQILEVPMAKGDKYVFMADFCRSDFLESAVHGASSMVNFNNPCIVEIWGFSRALGKEFLLAKTLPIKNIEWETTRLQFTAPERIDDLCIYLGYPGTEKTAGNVLIDNIRPLEITYSHPALPADSKYLKSLSTDSLLSTINKLELDLLNQPSISIPIRILLEFQGVSGRLNGQPLLDYIFETDKARVLKDIKILEAVKVGEPLAVLRKTYAIYLNRDKADEVEANYFTKSSETFRMAIIKEPLLENSIEYLRIHEAEVKEELIQLFY